MLISQTMEETAQTLSLSVCMLVEKVCIMERRIVETAGIILRAQTDPQHGQAHLNSETMCLVLTRS